MKEKILLAIKAKFPAVNLSKKRLDAIAATLEPKIADESEIDTKIDEFNGYSSFAEFAKQDDKIANLENKLKAPAVKKEGDTQPPNDDPMAAILESINKLSGELATMKQKEAQGTIKQEASKLLKDIPVSFWGKRSIPEKAEDLEAFATDVKADYGSFKQDLTEQGLSVLQVPRSGQSATQTAVAPEIKKFAESQAAKQAATVNKN